MKTLLYLLVLASAVQARGQQKLPASQQLIPLSSQIPVQQWQGKNLRYEIAVLSMPAKGLDHLHIYARFEAPGKNAAMPASMKLERREEQEWTIFTLAGKVEEEAETISFYAFASDNASYYFDDASCYIADAPAHWTQIRLSNPSFEKDELFSTNVGNAISPQLSGIVTAISDTIYKTGRHALMIRFNAPPVDPKISASMK